MKSLNQSLEDHYFKSNLYEDIVNRLQSQGTPLDKVSRVDISGVDEFHVRGAAVSKELADSIPLRGASVLDVGCGLGGPCRLLADEYDCFSTGIDLSAEYIRTAANLSQLVNLADKTKFVTGDATELPFEDGSFDAVWTQHVQMNIPDKTRFYSEIFRVLKPQGHFLYYDIFKANDKEVQYPMPWATKASQSFLFSTSDLEDKLHGLGFIKSGVKDQTPAGIQFFENLVARLKEHGPPNLGLNVLMGETTAPKLMNLLGHLREDILALESGIYKKQ